MWERKISSFSFHPGMVRFNMYTACTQMLSLLNSLLAPPFLPIILQINYLTMTPFKFDYTWFPHVSEIF
jgi:hypothetical protein